LLLLLISTRKNNIQAFQVEKIKAPHPASVPRSKKTGGILRGKAHEVCWDLGSAMAIAAATDGAPTLASICMRAAAAHRSLAKSLPVLNGEYPFRTTRTMICTNRNCAWHGNPQHRDFRAGVDIAIRAILALFASSDLLPKSRMSVQQLALVAATRTARDTDETAADEAKQSRRA
jgi:hypothetical protein